MALHEAVQQAIIAALAGVAPAAALNIVEQDETSMVIEINGLVDELEVPGVPVAAAPLMGPAYRAVMTEEGPEVEKQQRLYGRHETAKTLGRKLAADKVRMLQQGR